MPEVTAAEGGRRARHEIEFLPARLELQDSPPNPVGRAIIWAIIAFVLATGAWAYLSQIDIVAVAHGKIVPAGRSKVVQPLEIGRVSRIHVAEGQVVAEGDLLLELDITSQRADLERLRGDWMAAVASRARVQALLQAIDLPAEAPAPGLTVPDGVASAAVAAQQSLLTVQVGEYRAELRAKAIEVSRRVAELNSIRLRGEKLRQIIPLANDRAKTYRELAKRQLHNRLDYLEAEQERVELINDLAVLGANERTTREAVQKAEAEQDKLKANVRSRQRARLAELEQQIAALEQEVIKARTRAGANELRAPVAGVVQQLAVHTVGGVVTPAQELMTIVPRGQKLEIEALVENKDIGFIEVGQQAEVKLEAFPFTQFGTIPAAVRRIATDTVETQSGRGVFKLGAELEQDSIAVGNGRVALTPGMAVTLEVKTGTRRLADFFLAPLLRYSDESITER